MNEPSLLQRVLSGALQKLLVYGQSDTLKHTVYETLGDTHSIRPLVAYPSSFPVHHCGRYYEFDMGAIRNRNLDEFHRVLHEIISKPVTFNAYDYRILLLSGFTNVKLSVQWKLRRILDTPHVRFILVSQRFQSVLEPLRSRCVCVRISQDIPPPEYNDPYTVIARKLSDIYTHDFRHLTKPMLHRIKDIAFDVLKYNLSVPTFLSTLLYVLLCNPRFVHAIKLSIVSHIAQTEHQLLRSYRTIIHLEGVLVQLYYLTSTAHYEIHAHQEE